MARGDERRAWQVLANLLSNALKFSPPDSPVELRVIAAETGEVRFEVVDRGPGVAPEDQQRIFEKFSRAEGLFRGTEGTGLGLYIARSLADGQGGCMLVESEVGRGSTFTFILPRAGDDSRPGESGAGTSALADRPRLRSLDDRPASEGHANRRGGRHRSVARATARRRWRP